MTSDNKPLQQPQPKSPASSFAASLLALGEIAGYKLERVLGSGTYGVVLRASHLASGGNPCALKVFKSPLLKTESASLDSAWASLTTEARALELLGATAMASAAAASSSTAAALASSSSSSSNSLSGIPRLFEYGILKANSRPRGPAGAEKEKSGEGDEEDGEGGGGETSVGATKGSSNDGEQEEEEEAADRRKASPSSSAEKAKDRAKAATSPPDAVCHAWMAMELLGTDLWHLMRDTKQRAKANVAAAAAASSFSTSSSSSGGDGDGEGGALRRACKLSCRALLSELAPAMLGALEEVHSCGLVHRDVKLDNFATTVAASAAGGEEKEKGGNNNKPSAYLLDFGGISAAPSLAAGSSTVERALKGKKTCFFGTPEYCSSAAFTGEIPPTAAQDIEALGYCLVELWGGGRLPWGETFRARRETETERWSSANLAQMRAARDADWSKAVKSKAVPWWLESWIEHAKQQQQVFAGALAAAVARAGGSAASEDEASPPASVAAEGGGMPGMPNYRLLRSLLKAAAAQASAEAEVLQEAAAKGRVVAFAAKRGIVKMEE